MAGNCLIAWRPLSRELCVGWGVDLRECTVADQDLAGRKDHQCTESAERGVEMRSIKFVKCTAYAFDEGVPIGQKGRERISCVITIGKIGTDSPRSG